MPAPTLLPLDLTGSAAGNLIIDEVHTFTVSQDRRFVPSAGPFYPDSLVVRDNVSGRIMVPNLDYKVILPQRDAQMASGLDVSGAIWVNDTTAGSVRIRYQAVGGIYSNLYDTIIELLNNIPSNTLFGQVSWNQVFGQPVQYPPTSHMHDVRSLFNMGDVVNVLEKIRLAILTGDQGAFAAMYQYITNLLANNGYVTEQQFDDEVSTRQSADSRLDTLIKNASKINGYAIGALAMALVGMYQTRADHSGMFGSYTVDGLDVHIKPNGVLTQPVPYSDADGLVTTIPAVGVNLRESIQTVSPSPDTNPGIAFVYGRLTARNDSPDTVFAPDSLPDVLDYDNINEIEFSVSNTFSGLDITGINSELTSRQSSGWLVLLHVTVSPHTPPTPDAILGVIDELHWTSTVTLDATHQLASDSRALAESDRDSLAVIANQLSYVPINAYIDDGRRWMMAEIVDPVSTSSSFIWINSGALLTWRDDNYSTDSGKAHQAISRNMYPINVNVPVSGYNRYLVFAKPSGDEPNGVPDIQYMVKGPYTTTLPNTRSKSVDDDPMFNSDNSWLLVFGITVGSAGMTARDVTRYAFLDVNRKSRQAYDGLMTYLSLADLNNECDPPPLAYVSDIDTIYRWDQLATTTADGVIILATIASYNGTALTNGRYIRTLTNYDALLTQNGIGASLGLTNFLPNGTDPQDVLSPGKYYLEGSYPNIPNGFVRGILEVEVRDQNNRQLTLKSGNFDARIWIKNRHNNEGPFGADWGAWVELMPVTAPNGLGPISTYYTAGTYNLTLNPNETVRFYLVGGGGGGGGYTAAPGGVGGDTTLTIFGGNVLANVPGGGGGLTGYGADSNIYPAGPTPARTTPTFNKDYVPYMSEIHVNQDDLTPDGILVPYGIGGSPNPTTPSNWRYATPGGQAGCISFIYRNRSNNPQTLVINVGDGGAAGDGAATAGSSGYCGLVR